MKCLLLRPHKMRRRFCQRLDILIMHCATIDGLQSSRRRGRSRGSRTVEAVWLQRSLTSSTMLVLALNCSIFRLTEAIVVTAVTFVALGWLWLFQRFPSPDGLDDLHCQGATEQEKIQRTLSSERSWLEAALCSFATQQQHHSTSKFSIRKSKEKRVTKTRLSLRLLLWLILLHKWESVQSF